jgi:hypothetical protein
LKQNKYLIGVVAVVLKAVGGGVGYWIVIGYWIFTGIA